MKKYVYMVYKYAIECEHKEHERDMVDQLKEGPRYEMCGAGVASDGIVYSYSLKLIGKGKVKK